MSDTDKPKRDPNRPFPKPPKRKGVVLKFAVSAVLVVLTFWVVLYSMKIGKLPTEWLKNEADRAGFLTFSQEQVEEAKQNLQNIDWGKFGEKTKKLWDRVPELEKKLEQKLANLRKKKETATSTGEAATVAPAPPSELELGCESMRSGIRHYRKSMESQAELKMARVSFERAQSHFEKAELEAKAKDDDAEVSEIRSYLVECQRYLYDCIKLEKVEMPE